MFGSSEILIVAIVVLVLFGATALPKFFRSLGKAKNEFQKGASESESGNAAGNTGGNAGEAQSTDATASTDSTSSTQSNARE